VHHTRRGRGIGEPSGEGLVAGSQQQGVAGSREVVEVNEVSRPPDVIQDDQEGPAAQGELEVGVQPLRPLRGGALAADVHP
jgi:hypothetical protein